MAAHTSVRGVCCFPGCDRITRSSLEPLCAAHYTQRYRGEELRPLRNRVSAKKLPKGAAQIIDADGCKPCSQCLEVKPLADFHANRLTATGREHCCKLCRADLYDGGGKSRGRSLRRRYGLTLAQYDALLEQQGGSCAICHALPTDGKPLAVDHDHSCCPGDETCGSCVRGLLCFPCNAGIGHLADDVERILRAAAYISRERVAA